MTTVIVADHFFYAEVYGKMFVADAEWKIHVLIAEYEETLKPGCILQPYRIELQ